MCDNVSEDLTCIERAGKQLGHEFKVTKKDIIVKDAKTLELLVAAAGIPVNSPEHAPLLDSPLHVSIA